MYFFKIIVFFGKNGEYGKNMKTIIRLYYGNEKIL